MTEKSHVGMGYQVCPVCLAEHDPVVLLDTRLKNSLSEKHYIGLSMCPEHQKLKDEGYVALIETLEQPKSIGTAKRTGNIAHVRSSVWPQIFNTPVPENMFTFALPDVMETLKQMQTKEE